MSRVADQLEKVQIHDRSQPEPGLAETRLDPFLHKPQPRLWRRVKAVLTFDRMVILSFILIAVFVLTYRAAVYQPATENLVAQTEDELRRREPIVPAQTEKLLSVAAAKGETETSGVGGPTGLEVKAVDEIRAMDSAALEAIAETEMATAQLDVPPFKPYFTLQLATYDKKDRAQKELAWLTQHGLEGNVVTGNKKYLLSLGKFEDKKEAGKKLKAVFSGEFKKRYPDSYVRYVKD